MAKKRPHRKVAHAQLSSPAQKRGVVPAVPTARRYEELCKSIPELGAKCVRHGNALMADMWEMAEQVHELKAVCHAIGKPYEADAIRLCGNETAFHYLRDLYTAFEGKKQKAIGCNTAPHTILRKFRKDRAAKNKEKKGASHKSKQADPKPEIVFYGGDEDVLGGEGEEQDKRKEDGADAEQQLSAVYQKVKKALATVGSLAWEPELLYSTEVDEILQLCLQLVDTINQQRKIVGQPQKPSKKAKKTTKPTKPTQPRRPSKKAKKPKKPKAHKPSQQDDLASKVVEVLGRNPSGLKLDAITLKVINAGYKTKSQNLTQAVYKVLAKLREDDKVVKDEATKKWTLAEPEDPKARPTARVVAEKPEAATKGL